MKPINLFRVVTEVSIFQCGFNQSNWFGYNEAVAKLKRSEPRTSHTAIT